METIVGEDVEVPREGDGAGDAEAACKAELAADLAMSHSVDDEIDPGYFFSACINFY